MAHAAQISKLTSDLIDSLTIPFKKPAVSKRVRDQSIRALRNTNHGRTNQFDVQSKLNGLIEKFAVLNREDLSEVLESRLNELPKTKWTPEILSFLLELSDRPVEKTTVEIVEALVKPNVQDEATVSWAEILVNERHNESGLWDDVERGYHSSGDEAADGVDESDDTTSTHATSIGENDVVALARSHIKPYDASTLDEIRDAHARLRTDATDVSISELTLIRETLTMLHGLPTSVYNINASTGKVSLNQKFFLETATQYVTHQMLASFVNIASSLNALRYWVQKEQSASFLKTCQAAIQDLLLNFGRQISNVEQPYLAAQKSTVVSIAVVRKATESLARPLTTLARVIEDLDAQLISTPHEMLDALYDQANILQMSGDDELFSSLISVFIPTLRTYLRPVSAWIGAGSLTAAEKTFFITDANTECESSRLWEGRFAMRTLPNGRPAVPKFLQSLAPQVFALGKSRAFLTALGDEGGLELEDMNLYLPKLDGVQQHMSANSFLPFSRILDEVLRSWLAESSTDCTPQLCKNLLYERGLLRTIDGLGYSFCSENGMLFQTFAETLFWRMERNPAGWRDRFLLTELAMSTLGSPEAVDAAALSVVLKSDDPSTNQKPSIRQLDTISLENVFTWQIQNITRCRSPSAYSHAFIFLLQIYRAKHLLRQQFFAIRTVQHSASGLAQTLSKSLRLRQHLLSTVDTLFNHLTNTANTLRLALREEIEHADGIDTMAANWKQHHSAMETSLLLAPNLSPIRDALTSILELCEQFSNTWKHNLKVSSDLGNDEDGEALEDSEDEDSKAFHHESSATISQLQSELSQSLSFVVAGLHGVSRAGGNTVLETLAERLQWSVH